MSEAKHTPGPWTVHEKGAHPYPFVSGPFVPVEWGEDNFLVSYLVGVDAKANGHLIAAAPDLLYAIKALRIQALQSTVNHPSNEWGSEALGLAEAAIRKAEGRL